VHFGQELTVDLNMVARSAGGTNGVSGHGTHFPQDKSPRLVEFSANARDENVPNVD
jgi:hypothetical protein